MVHEKTITVDVYNCPGCNEELLLSVMKEEGRLCPTCEDEKDKQLTTAYWSWLCDCKVVGIYVADYRPKDIHSIILELPDKSRRRIYPCSYQRIEYSEWEDDMGITEWAAPDEMVD